MALFEYEDQLVPTLTPCSAASLTLNIIRLPRTQSSVGLPRRRPERSKARGGWVLDRQVSEQVALDGLDNNSPFF